MYQNRIANWPLVGWPIHTSLHSRHIIWSRMGCRAVNNVPVALFPFQPVFCAAADGKRGEPLTIFPRAVLRRNTLLLCLTTASPWCTVSSNGLFFSNVIDILFSLGRRGCPTLIYHDDDVFARRGAHTTAICLIHSAGPLCLACLLPLSPRRHART